MHTLAHRLICNFQRSFGGASVKICSPDASFPKGKAEGSGWRIKRMRSFVLVPEIKERSAKKYHTKCQIEKDVVHADAK
jgi:hypothetical protein